jgi:hypothetical protein
LALVRLALARFAPLRLAVDRLVGMKPPSWGCGERSVGGWLRRLVLRFRISHHFAASSERNSKSKEQ